MGDMEKVRVTICDTKYSFTTDESPAYMQELAAGVEAEIQKLMENPRVTLTMAAVITAMDCRDAAQKAVGDADNLREQMKAYLDENNRLRAEAEEARRQAAQLRQKLAGGGRF